MSLDDLAKNHPYLYTRKDINRELGWIHHMHKKHERGELIPPEAHTQPLLVMDRLGRLVHHYLVDALGEDVQERTHFLKTTNLKSQLQDALYNFQSQHPVDELTAHASKKLQDNINNRQNHKALFAQNQEQYRKTHPQASSSDAITYALNQQKPLTHLHIDELRSIASNQSVNELHATHGDFIDPKAILWETYKDGYPVGEPTQSPQEREFARHLKQHLAETYNSDVLTDPTVIIDAKKYHGTQSNQLHELSAFLNGQSTLTELIPYRAEDTILYEGSRALTTNEFSQKGTITAVKDRQVRVTKPWGEVIKPRTEESPTPLTPATMPAEEKAYQNAYQEAIAQYLHGKITDQHIDEIQNTFYNALKYE